MRSNRLGAWALFMVLVAMAGAAVAAEGGLAEALLDGPLAGLDAGLIGESRTALELGGVNQLEAERLMAVADAAVYAEHGGRLLVLLNPAWSDPETLAGWLGASSGSAPEALAVAPREEMSLAGFAAALDQRLPGLAEGAWGRHMLKVPTRVASPDDIVLSPDEPEISPTTDVLVQGFEAGFHPSWTNSRWLRSPGSGSSYSWAGVDCDAASGSVSIDGWRGGFTGSASQDDCAAFYPHNLGPLFAYDSQGVNISGASQAWLELSVAIWTEDWQGDSLSILFYDPRDTSWVGFWHAGTWYAPWWRFTYDLRHWIDIGDLTRFTSNNLAFAFMSDGSINPGFGARVDDVRITKNTTPSLTCSASATPTWGAAALSVDFTGNYVGSLPMPDAFWAFDDGWSSTSQDPTHTYDTSGDYDAWFEVASTTNHKKCLTTVHVTAHRGGDDNCSGATVMTPSFTQSFSTVGYTRDQPGTVPTTACNTVDGYEPGATRWYTFTPTRAGSGRAWACPGNPSSYQPWLTTFTGSCGAMTWRHCWRFDAISDCGGPNPTPVLDMTPGTVHTWQVGGHGDQAGSGTMRFEFCPYPLAFAQSSPSGGATVTATPVTLQWQSAADATSYDVSFGTTNPPPLYQNVAGTSLQVPVANGVYHWTVTAKNACGETDSSSGVWSFTAALSADIFGDGFENGGTTAWSSTVP